MASVRVVLNHAGINDLLKRDDIVEAIGDMADKVAAAARGRGVLIDGEPGDIPLPVESAVSVQGGKARGVVYVPHGAGLAAESKHRLLAGSLDVIR